MQVPVKYVFIAFISKLVLYIVINYLFLHTHVFIPHSHKKCVISRFEINLKQLNQITFESQRQSF